MHQIAMLFAAALLVSPLIFTSEIHAAPVPDELSYFDIRMELDSGAGEITAINAIVVKGAAALSTWSVQDSAFQVRYRIAKTYLSAAGKAVAEIELGIFERSEALWVELANPTIALELGAEASFTIDSSAATAARRGGRDLSMALSIAPLSGDEVMARTGRPDLPTGTDCEHPAEAGAESNCCRIMCGGLLWTCCNVVACCCEGFCCSPP